MQCCREPGIEGESFRVEGERDEAGFSVGVIAHQDGQLSAGFQGTGAVADELAVSREEMLQGR